MAITYTHKPTGEQVNKEPWRWVAEYKDGTSLRQFEVTVDAGAVFHRFEDIDQAQLKRFSLEHDKFPTIEVRLPEQASPLHFYRHTILNAGSPAEERFKLWCIGYRLDKEIVYMAAHQDGRVELIKEQKEN